MTRKSEKDLIAARLAEAHRAAEPDMVTIVQIFGDREEEESEPLKLLEVNAATSPSGVLPIAFSPDPPEVPFPSIVVEVTEREYNDIQSGALALPDGWRLGRVLYERKAA